MIEKLTDTLQEISLRREEQAVLTQRFKNMTVKNSLLFRGDMELEQPDTGGKVFQIIENLEQYQLFYGAGDNKALGCFVLDQVHRPTPEACAYFCLETVGESYRQREGGCFVEGHYVQRLYSSHPMSESISHLLSEKGDYAIRIKLISPTNQSGVWVGFPDTAEYMDPANPDELRLGLDALGVETVAQCMAVDVDCALSQITDILAQYDSTDELIRHAIDLGYIWAERGQGERYWLEKWQAVLEWKNCHRLDQALDLAQNLHCFEFLPWSINLAKYGMELARRNGVLGQDDFLDACFDAAAYAEAQMDKLGMSAVEQGYVAWNGREVIYEYSQPEQEVEMIL